MGDESGLGGEGEKAEEIVRSAVEVGPVSEKEKEWIRRQVKREKRRELWRMTGKPLVGGLIAGILITAAIVAVALAVKPEQVYVSHDIECSDGASISVGYRVEARYEGADYWLSYHIFEDGDQTIYFIYGEREDGRAIWGYVIHEGDHVKFGHPRHVLAMGFTAP